MTTAVAADFAPSVGDQTTSLPFIKRTGDACSLDLVVTGARCGACLSKIEGTLRDMTGVTSARLNLSTGRLRVDWRGQEGLGETIIETLDGLGYPARPFDPDTATAERRKRERYLLSCLGVAGFAMANIMLLSVSVWAGGADMDAETRTLFHWISALIALPAIAYAGRPFFASAWSVLRTGHVNMDVPISLAVVLSQGYSIYETLHKGEHAYFDAGVMLLFFLLIGRFLDARLQREAHSAASDLAAMQAVSVRQALASGETRMARAQDLALGDRIILAKGERLPVNAALLSASATLDSRLVTGESRPMTIASGAIMYAGSVNAGAPIEAEVRSSADDSLLTDISKLLEAGEQKRSRYRQIADFAASLYSPIVHTLAASAFFGWLYFTGDWKLALFTAISTLVITCPCALALAAPVVQVVAAGRLFRGGVYLKSGDALERIAACDYVVFDKTGTLTHQSAESPCVSDEDMARNISDAAMLARASDHPVSRAISDAAGPGPLAAGTEEVAGGGILGRIDGQTARLGRYSFVIDDPDSDHRSGVWFRKGERGEPVALPLDDIPLPGLADLGAALSRLGLPAEILSGDANDRVRTIARGSGIGAFAGDVSPIDKANRLAELEAAGRKVLMVGDGLNDAGALASAHAALAPGGALHITQAASDGVYAPTTLARIPDIIRHARIATNRTKQNFGLAIIYNCIAVPIALAGLVTPLVAAIAMSASSVVVVLNALRIPHLPEHDT